MAKVSPYLKILGLLLMLAAFSSSTIAQYRLNIQPVDKDSTFLSSLKINRSFTSKEQCAGFVSRLPELLKSKNYPNGSVDSVWFDTSTAWVQLYVGEPASAVVLKFDSAEDAVLRQMGQRQNKKALSSAQLEDLQNRILTHLENNGYPFAAVALNDVQLSGDTLAAKLKIDKGPLYKIDSIRNMGRAAISDGYLQQYLGIRNGSMYRKDKLEGVSPRLRELPFVREVQPWNMTLLGTGSVLNLYLDPKKSSEVNVLIGLLPANEQLKDNKMLITGDANINLKNALGGGETIGLNWQQIQVKSPRLNLVFQQPYLFGSPFGLNFNFDLFKKDSSFVNIGILLGASYAVSSAQTGSVFLQRLTTNLLTVDTLRVKQSRRLPAEADVSSVNLGLSYDWNKTDYRFNPRRGVEWSITGSVGTRNIRKNNIIVKLYDTNSPQYDYNSLYDTFQLKSYQFRIRFKGARYLPLGRASTLKTGLSAGWFQSPSIFRNELFQIGGYKLLRGFDEESIFASAYAVATVEYRYLIGQNSFLAAFVDYGASQNKSITVNGRNRFLGAGLAMAFETKAGIFNITYAAGKRDDQKFNLRQSKIHLGYVNYF
jgi:outer membrane protein assembly factor BamA